MSRLAAALGRPVPIASLAVYRILFGALLFASTVRFMASDWIEVFYVRSTFHFKYPGFEWVAVLPPWAMYALYGAAAACALCVALGLFYRVAVVAFVALFAYAELTDVTNYLNHYYLVLLMGSLLALTPAHGKWSLDVLRRPSLARAEVPAWMLWLLRFQVAMVYLHAGLAKAGPDWLLHAQPLQIWLRARDETPILGPLFGMTATAYVFSWAGFLFDTTIAGWLLWKRSRPFAFAAVLAFHFMTHVLFDIGIFPFLMTINATLFFDPDWPSRARTAPSSAPSLPPRWAWAPLAAFLVFQALFPLRSWLYPGDVLWHEQGMRWSWKVMVREKNGSVVFHVRDPKTGRTWERTPAEFLILRQEFEMAGQPDLIVQMARHIAEDERRKGRGDVEVRCDARVSLNGRAARPLIDPAVDLVKVREGFRPAAWILGGPSEPPLHLSAR
jgi:vitamin K-dependent gamma-carboxylase